MVLVPISRPKIKSFKLKPSPQDFVHRAQAVNKQRGIKSLRTYRSKAVSEARKRVALKRTLRKSTLGLVKVGEGAKTVALQRAVRMLKR